MRPLKPSCPRWPRSVSGPADRMSSLFNTASMWKTQHEVRVLGSWACRAGVRGGGRGKDTWVQAAHSGMCRPSDCLGTLLSMTLTCVSQPPRGVGGTRRLVPDAVLVTCVAVINPRDQGSLEKEGFIRTYSSRGLRVHHGRES